jgi:hypothetical protein
MENTIPMENSKTGYIYKIVSEKINKKVVRVKNITTPKMPNVCT